MWRGACRWSAVTWMRVTGTSSRGDSSGKQPASGHRGNFRAACGRGIKDHVGEEMLAWDKGLSQRWHHGICCELLEDCCIR